jgi:hypothetical protein
MNNSKTHEGTADILESSDAMHAEGRLIANFALQPSGSARFQMVRGRGVRDHHCRETQ